MKFYDFLSRLKFLNKYSYKFLFISFIGIHIPLIGLILFIVIGPDHELKPSAIISITLLLTLMATGATLYFLHQLIAPIRVLQSTLHDYLTQQKLPVLPTHYQDEVGVLMHDIQHAIIDINFLLEEKKDLLTLLSHDLRSPIFNTQQAISVLKKEQEPQIKEKLFQVIEKSANQQLELIQTIVNLWRHENTNVQLYQLKPVQVRVIIDDVLKQQELALTEKDIEVQIKTLQEHYVYAEPSLINEVFNNLIVNAIKFSVPGGMIRIWSEKLDGKIRISLQDEGLGFNPDEAEALFQRFTPYRKKGTKGEETIGLGLYICRKLLLKQEATITAESAGLDKGATFIVEFNAADPE